MGQAVLRSSRVSGCTARRRRSAFYERRVAFCRKRAPGWPEAEALVADLFPRGAYDHHGWRLAAVQDLAREAGAAPGQRDRRQRRPRDRRHAPLARLHGARRYRPALRRSMGPMRLIRGITR